MFIKIFSEHFVKIWIKGRNIAFELKLFQEYLNSSSSRSRVKLEKDFGFQNRPRIVANGGGSKADRMLGNCYASSNGHNGHHGHPSTNGHTSSTNGHTIIVTPVTSPHQAASASSGAVAGRGGSSLHIKQNIRYAVNYRSVSWVSSLEIQMNLRTFDVV